MVGVCLTSISLIKLLEEKAGYMQVDEYLALNSIIFLGSAVFAYFAMRTHVDRRHKIIFERIADALFVGGLIAMVIIATLFAYQEV